MNKRVDYIDVIKGVAIWGVIWRHTSHPDWLTLNFIFFILGGFFFKRKPITLFLKEKIQYIIIPFLFFYIVSYPYQILVHYWDYGTLSSFRWGCILDLFSVSTSTNYLIVNMPLWFLICFFVIQLLYYFISYLDKRLIFAIVILCLCSKSFLFSIPTPFMINAAFYYMGFFALGNLVGKPWIEKLKEVRFRRVSLIISIFLFAALFIPINNLNDWMYDAAYAIKLLMAFFIMMSVASWFNEKRYLSLLRFYGENSLTILGLHLLPLIVLQRISYAILGEYTPLIGFIQSTIVMAIMYVVILFCNRYIPFLVGKKQLKATV